MGPPVLDWRAIPLAREVDIDHLPIEGDPVATGMGNPHMTFFVPDAAAVEQTFVNKDAVGTLKLGQARGVALLAPAQAGIAVGEYAPNAVKKAIVGVGHAQKQQVEHMVRFQLPGVELAGPDAADALAIAICHARHLQSRVLRIKVVA